MSDDVTITSEEGTELTISAHELRMVTGYYELEERMLAAEEGYGRVVNALEQVLGYMNNIDERIQLLAGEPIVSKQVVPHIDKAGYLRLESTPPAVPEEIIRAFQAGNKKPSESGRSLRMVR